MPGTPLLILDRDGVLNRMCVNAEHGTIDSPLHPSQVEIIEGVPEALKRLQDAGWTLAIATNQPAAAYGKTTRANLDAVHAKVLEAIQAKGARIASSHICFHTNADKCECRKPKPGLLKESLAQHGATDLSHCWMVGDGVTDIQAGAALGIRTAFLGPTKCDHCKIFEEHALKPHFWGAKLTDFVDFLLKK